MKMLFASKGHEGCGRDGGRCKRDKLFVFGGDGANDGPVGGGKFVAEIVLLLLLIFANEIVLLLLIFANGDEIELFRIVGVCGADADIICEF
uniref:Uncharacterized protein n=1 Tax=Panagrolaimus sp. ES5 TaxID=591445 RepID=A0AC34GBL7_9BILA